MSEDQKPKYEDGNKISPDVWLRVTELQNEREHLNQRLYADFNLKSENRAIHGVVGHNSGLYPPRPGPSRPEDVASYGPNVGVAQRHVIYVMTDPSLRITDMDMKDAIERVRGIGRSQVHHVANMPDRNHLRGSCFLLLRSIGAHRFADDLRRRFASDPDCDVLFMEIVL